MKVSYEDACLIARQHVTTERLRTLGIDVVMSEYQQALTNVGWTSEALCEEAKHRMHRMIAFAKVTSLMQAVDAFGASLLEEAHKSYKDAPADQKGAAKIKKEHIEHALNWMRAAMGQDPAKWVGDEDSLRNLQLTSASSALRHLVDQAVVRPKVEE